ncbi:MAG: hypothetical protein ACKOQP_02030 [Bacteroidota bacterium]
MMQFLSRFRWALVIALPLLMVGMSGCYFDNEKDLYGIATPCDTSAVSYANDIQGIITNNCQGCHNNQSASGNLNLESTASRTANINKILTRITRPSGDPLVMPTSGPMPACQINKIRAWSNQGLPTNN